VSERLVIRADAGPAIGSGHVMRCLALGEEWARRDGSVEFVLAEGAGSFGSRIRSAGIETRPIEASPGTREDAERTLEIARDASWIAVDGYSFDRSYLSNVRTEAGILLVDDAGSAAADLADLVLNQNLHATPSLYAARGGRTRLLLGPDYLLLRRQFVDRNVRSRQVPETARRILVTLGGSDAHDHTSRVLEALDRRAPEGTEVVVTVGAASPHAGKIEDLARRMRLAVDVVRDAPDMAAIMARVDAAVCSGGTTVWELAYMQVPTLVGTTVPVEDLLLGGLVARGFVGALGPFSALDPDALGARILAFLEDVRAREASAAFGARMVDGRGASRVVDAMREESRS